MAFSTPGAGDRYILKAQFVDNGNQQAGTAVELPFQTDIATTINKALAYLTAMQVASQAKLERASMTMIFFDDAAPGPSAGSRVSDDGQIAVNLDVSGDAKTPTGVIHLPAPAEAVRVSTSGSGYYLLDTDNADIVDITDLFESGGGLTLSDGQISTGTTGGVIFPKKLKRR